MVLKVVLQLACVMAPSGVAPPIQMAVRAPGENGQLSAGQLLKTNGLNDIKAALELFRADADREKKVPRSLQYTRPDEEVN